MTKIQNLEKNDQTFDRLYDYFNVIISSFNEGTSGTKDCATIYYNALLHIDKVFFRGCMI